MKKNGSMPCPRCKRGTMLMDILNCYTCINCGHTSLEHSGLKEGNELRSYAYEMQQAYSLHRGGKYR